MTDLTRRQALFLALAAGLPLAGAVSRARAAAQKITVALDWTVNTNHIGLFVARDKGFYRDAGLEVEILPYGDTGSGTLVANRVADFGVSGSLGLLTQKSAGADLKAVYAVVQSETGRVVFNADRAAITSPKNLDGLTYGGFGSAWENALISTIIRHDGGKGVFNTVTLGTSAYEALANGAVDFTLEVSTWEGVEAELKGLKQRSFRYADYGVPDEHTTLIVSSNAFLAANRQAAAAFVQSTRRLRSRPRERGGRPVDRGQQGHADKSGAGIRLAAGAERCPLSEERDRRHRHDGEGKDGGDGRLSVCLGDTPRWRRQSAEGEAEFGDLFQE